MESRLVHSLCYALYHIILPSGFDQFFRNHLQTPYFQLDAVDTQNIEIDIDNQDVYRVIFESTYKIHISIEGLDDPSLKKTLLKLLAHMIGQFLDSFQGDVASLKFINLCQTQDLRMQKHIKPHGKYQELFLNSDYFLPANVFDQRNGPNGAIMVRNTQTFETLPSFGNAYRKPLKFDGFCNHGNLREAIGVLDFLQNNGYAIDMIRLLRLAKLCDRPEALEEPKFVHERIVSLSPPSDVSSRNGIIEMYYRCGYVLYAVTVFHDMSEMNTETWCVMMRCLVSNGYGDQAIGFFNLFKREGNKPDGEIFNEVFSAYAFTGDTKKGLLQFEAMQKDYGIKPTMEHYHIVTKMLATSGHLDERYLALLRKCQWSRVLTSGKR
ncbi:hypothetical protein YC2023_092225 [Brassica napus]